MLEEALEIAEERQEVKVKGEMERYTQVNAEFQRVARRGKALYEQCQKKKKKRGKQKNGKD